MSIRDCILAKQKAGKIDEERATEALDLIDRLEADMAERMSPADAAAQAARKAVEILEAKALRKRANTYRQALIAAGIKRDLETYRMANGKLNMGRAALGVLSRDLTGRSTRANVESRYQSVLGLAHAKAEAFLSGYRAKTSGLRRDKAGLKNIVRERFGEETGDPAAKAAAEVFGDAAEFLRLRFNAAGGDIKKRVDWGLPQSHDTIEVGAVGREEWMDFIRPRLDRAEMIDFETGLAMSEFALEDLLVQTYERIRTGGMVDVKPGTGGRRKALANRRTDPRVLVFKDAEAWLTYQERFGHPDVFQVLNNHFDGMAMDIARMEVLGPNPEHTVAFMTDLIRKDAAGKGKKARDRGEGAITVLRRVNDDHTGRALVPVNAKFARGMQGLRNILTSAQLGAAALSAISDFAYQRLARSFNGLPAVSKAIPDILRLMNPLDVSDQKFAVRMGLVAENWSSMALAQKRYAGDVIGPQWTRLFSDVVLKASLLSPYTQAGRWAFGLEFLGHLGDLRATRLADMPEPTANALRRVGIGEGDWLKVKAAALAENRGAEFLDLPKLYETAPEVAAKIHQMIVQETEFAVPTTSSRVRTWFRQGTRPGTFAGEVMTSIAMYKSFPVSIIHLHVMRGLYQENLTRKGLYLANLIISSTVMGALSWQSKHIQRGKDPQDMTDPKFWEAAMIQGGGLGIFGDFLFSDVNRFGGGAVTTLAGPVAKFGDDAFSLLLGNARQGLEGEKTNMGREAVRFSKRYLPGGSLWYSRLALERLIFDELQRIADPQAHQAWRRMQRRLKRDSGQNFFWAPGRRKPSHLPDLGKAIGK